MMMFISIKQNQQKSKKSLIILTFFHFSQTVSIHSLTSSIKKIDCYFVINYNNRRMMAMIFYSRKNKREKIDLRETSTSMGLRQIIRPQTSNNSLRKVNIRLLSASKENVKKELQKKVPEESKSAVQFQNFFIRPGQSALKKRGRQDDLIHKALDCLKVSSSSWCLFDSELKKYVGFREDHKRQVASLTKIMTVLISIEVLEKISISYAKVKITSTAASLIGTSASLRSGYWITLKDLLYGTMLPSGNDAAYSLAEYIGYILSHMIQDSLRANLFQNKIDLTAVSTNGFVNEFLRAMNNKAKKLNLMSTWFSNPHGLQNAFNTSSAKDILKLSKHASKNALFRHLMNTTSHQYFYFQDQQFTIQNEGFWKNTNRLLHKGWEGIKTGNTQAAGSCLSSLKEGIYIVVLNCQNQSARFSDTEKIYEWYKSNISKKHLLASQNSTVEIAEVKVNNPHFKTQSSI